MYINVYVTTIIMFYKASTLCTFAWSSNIVWYPSFLGMSSKMCQNLSCPPSSPARNTCWLFSRTAGSPFFSSELGMLDLIANQSNMGSIKCFSLSFLNECQYIMSLSAPLAWPLPGQDKLSFSSLHHPFSLLLSAQSPSVITPWPTLGSNNRVLIVWDFIIHLCCLAKP